MNFEIRDGRDKRRGRDTEGEIEKKVREYFLEPHFEVKVNPNYRFINLIGYSSRIYVQATNEIV